MQISYILLGISAWDSQSSFNLSLVAFSFSLVFMMSSFTFFSYFLIISIGLTLDLFYLSILGKDDPNCCRSHFFFSSSILLTLSINEPTRVFINFMESQIPYILLLFNLRIELLRIGLRLPAIDDLKLLWLSLNKSFLESFRSSQFDSSRITSFAGLYYFKSSLILFREFSRVFILFLFSVEESNSKHICLSEVEPFSRIPANYILIVSLSLINSSIDFLASTKWSAMTEFVLLISSNFYSAFLTTSTSYAFTSFFNSSKNSLISIFCRGEISSSPPSSSISAEEQTGSVQNGEDQIRFVLMVTFF